MKEKYLTDMSRCEPSQTLSREHKKGAWFLTDYETENGIKGTMMYALSSENPPVLTLPLDQAGWHAVYVGVNYTRTPEEDAVSASPVRIKLTGDKAYTRIGQEGIFRHTASFYPEKMGREREKWGSVYEVFWKNADLTGQSLAIDVPRVLGRNHSALVNLSWIMLFPLSEKEIEAARSDLPTAETRRLAACYCLGGDFSRGMQGSESLHPRDPESVRDLIEPFRDSDFELLLLERGGEKLRPAVESLYISAISSRLFPQFSFKRNPKHGLWNCKSRF